MQKCLLQAETTTCISAKYTNTPAVSLDTSGYGPALSFTVPYRLWSGGGIALSKDEFEELQTLRQYISGLVPQEIEVQEALNNGDSVSDDELAEKKLAAVIYPQLCVPAGRSEDLLGTMAFYKESVAVLC